VRVERVATPLFWSHADFPYLLQHVHESGGFYHDSKHDLSFANAVCFEKKFLVDGSQAYTPFRVILQ
jgi:hypothetical protein